MRYNDIDGEYEHWIFISTTIFEKYITQGVIQRRAEYPSITGNRKRRNDRLQNEDTSDEYLQIYLIEMYQGGKCWFTGYTGSLQKK